MTFIECCKLIKEIKNDYKIIYPSQFSPHQYSFRFESQGVQRDAFDIIYHHYETLPPHDKSSLSSRIRACGIPLADALLLINLSNGAWKKVPSFQKEEYDSYREIFERITGIEVT